MMELELNHITNQIIGACIEVHKILGPGLLESAYEECLSYELNRLEIPFVRQLGLPVVYKGTKLDCGYRVDLLVASKIAVEIKSVSELTAVHKAQLLTYLRLGGWPLGLLVNFNVHLLRRGIKRLIHTK